MMLTKGAIGNLINRYSAVLKKCSLINTFGSLAVAGMLVLGGAGVVGAATDYGTNTLPETTPITFKGTDITYDGNVYINSSGDGVYFEQTEEKPKGTITLGSASSIIDIHATSNAVVLFDGFEFGQTYEQGMINVTGKTISLTSEGTGWVSGLQVGSDVTAYTATNNTINVTSTEGTFISVKTSEATKAEALVAMSGGILNIDGPLYAKAYDDNNALGNVISTRGGATINIGQNGHTVKLEGDVEFDYDELTSGTEIDADVNIKLSGAESYWKGNTYKNWM